MENSTRIGHRIEEIIEELACYNNPGPTAVKAAETITDEYLLVPKSDLPLIEVTNGKAHLDSITEYVCNGDTRTMRRQAYQYLAMSDFLENRKIGAVQKLHDERLAIWKELHQPDITFEANWKFENLDESDQRAIEMIRNLRIQIDG